MVPDFLANVDGGGGGGRFGGGSNRSVSNIT